MNERILAELAQDVTLLAANGRLDEALHRLRAVEGRGGRTSASWTTRLARFLGVRPAPVPGRVRLLILRGDVLVRLRRGDEAGACYDQAVADAERGTLRAAERRDAAAELDFQHLLAVAHLQRSAHLCAQGERAPALGSVEAALRLLAGPVDDPVLRAEGCHLRAMLLSHAVFRFTLLLDRARTHLARLGHALEVSVQSFRGSGMMARALGSAGEGIDLLESVLARNAAGREVWVDGSRASRRELQERLLEQLYVGLRIALAVGDAVRAARWLERGLLLAEHDPAATRAFLRLGVGCDPGGAGGPGSEAAMRSAASVPATLRPQWLLRTS